MYYFDMVSKNVLKKIEKYIKITGYTSAYLYKNFDVVQFYDLKRSDFHSFNAIFDYSKVLNVDIRNLLLLDNENTYIFENSFDNYKEFLCFLGRKLKSLRLERGLKAKDVAPKVTKGSINYIYRLESSKESISPKKLYAYLEVLGMTSDEFFLHGEEYRVITNQNKNNQITIDDINKRVYELEEIRDKDLSNYIANNPNTYPTLHGLLKMCKVLGVSPAEFFDFSKKDFEKTKVIDIKKSAEFFKMKLEENDFKTQRYIRLDSIFSLCDEQNISIIDFFKQLEENDVKNECVFTQ